MLQTLRSPDKQRRDDLSYKCPRGDSLLSLAEVGVSSEYIS